MTDLSRNNDKKKSQTGVGVRLFSAVNARRLWLQAAKVLSKFPGSELINLLARIRMVRE
jgi:hypothetical protein